MAANQGLLRRDHVQGALDETHSARIGVSGFSYSGAHVPVVAAVDRRVRCVVSQVPVVSGWHGFRRLVRADFMAGVEAQFHADRAQRAAGSAPTMVPVVASDPMTPSALPTADSDSWFTEAAAQRAPSWKNDVTVGSREYGFGYERALEPKRLVLLPARPALVFREDWVLRMTGELAGAGLRTPIACAS